MSWREAVTKQAAEDFHHEEIARDAEEQLVELKTRAAVLGDEIGRLDPERDKWRRNELGLELQSLEPQIRNLEVTIPFLGFSDDELAGVVEDRKIEAEEAAVRVKQANDPRFVTSPTRLKRIERQAQEASLAATQAEVALNTRREVAQARAMAEATAQKRAVNDALEAEQAERIKMANERDPRVRLDYQIEQAQRMAELLAQDREHAQETLREAGIVQSPPSGESESVGE